MRHRYPVTLLALLLTAGPASAQIMAAIGPAFPTGDFNSIQGAGTGWFASGRVGFSFVLLSLQLEASYSRMTVADPQAVSEQPVRRAAGGANLAVHLIRVGGVRPYILVGASFGRRRVGEDPVDASWRSGYHAGAGADFAFGPLKPFAELRYMSLDAPGSIRDTYVPLLIGLRIL